VDKRLLTSREPSIDAGFNKLPIERAKSKSNKINDLSVLVF